MAELDYAVERLLPPFDPDYLLERLDAIPGVGRLTAQRVIAELRIDMSRFASDAHATSWAGLAPGKNDSAGRNPPARSRPIVA